MLVGILTYSCQTKSQREFFQVHSLGIQYLVRNDEVEPRDEGYKEAQEFLEHSEKSQQYLEDGLQLEWQGFPAKGSDS